MARKRCTTSCVSRSDPDGLIGKADIVVNCGAADCHKLAQRFPRYCISEELPESAKIVFQILRRSAALLIFDDHRRDWNAEAMPNVDGFEIVRRIRAAPGGSLTGYGHDDDRRLTQAAGFDHHVTKPADLADALRSLLAHNRIEKPAG